MKKISCLLLLTAVFGVFAAKPVFYLNFDGTAVPAAAGNKSFRTDTAPQYQKGLRGQAMLIGTDDRGNRHGAAYPVEKNFNWNRGSISFWFKPVNWKGSDQNFFIFFFTAFARNAHFLLYKYHEGEIFYINRSNGSKIHNAQHLTGEWNKNEWHHIVCNFDDLQLAIYQDGKLITERRRVFPFTLEKPEKEFQVGETKRSWLYKKNGRLSLMDEFKIFDRPLSLDEIRALYHKDAAAAKVTNVNFVTVPKAPDTFRSTGFTDLKTGEYAYKQHRYTINFDDKNLLVRLSPADKKAVLLLTDPQGKVHRYPFESEVKAPKPAAKGWMFNIVTSHSDLDGGAHLFLDDKLPSGGIHSVCNRKTTEFRLNVLPTEGKEITCETNSTMMYGYRSYTRDISKGYIWQIKDMHQWWHVSLRLRDKATKKEYYRSDLRIRKNQPLAVKFMYTIIKKRQLCVAFQGKTPGTLLVEFQDKSGKALFSEKQPVPKIPGSFFDLYFPIKAQPGTYAVNIFHISSSGKKALIWQQNLRVPPKNDPLVAPHIDPDKDKVPMGWTPVKVSGSTVNIWGRTIKLDKGVLFGSIVSQNKSLMAEPDTLILDGKRLTAKSIKVEKISAGEVNAKFRKTVDFGVLKAQSIIDVAFDGYTQIDLKVIPSKPMKIKLLAWEMPLENKYVKLLRGNKTFSPLTGKVGNEFSMAFAQHNFRAWPIFWIGDYQTGINFTAEHLINWHYTNVNGQLTFKRDAQAGRMQIRFVTAPLLLDKARNFQFGITPTPHKPLKKATLRQRSKKEWQTWFKPWKYFNNLDPNEIFTKAPYFGMDYLHRQQREFKELFHYSAYNFCSPFVPEFAWYEEEWRQLLRNGIGTWTLYTSSCAAGCINGEKYRNYRVNIWKKFIEMPNNPLMPKGAQNLYFDAPWEESCQNPAHGCQDWIDSMRRPRTKLLINHFRSMSLSLYRILHRRYPDALICYHHEWQRSIPSHTFADVFMTGEGMENQVARIGSYYDLLTPAMFAATMSPYIWSTKTIFVPQVVRGIFLSAQAKARTYDIDKPVWRKAHLHYMGYAVTHDVDLPERNKLSYMLWAAQDAVGWNGKTVFHPYYDEKPAVRTLPANERIIASAYTNNGKMLLAILNDTDKEETVTLSFDFKKLGIKPGMTARNVWDPKQSFALKDQITVKVSARGFVLLPFIQ